MAAEKRKYSDFPLTPKPADFNLPFDWPTSSDCKTPTARECLEAKTPKLNEQLRALILSHFTNVDLGPRNEAKAKQKLDFDNKEQKQVSDLDLARQVVRREPLIKSVECVQMEITSAAFGKALSQSKFFN